MNAIHVMKTSSDVIKTTTLWRSEGLSIGFVPTMGALHRGHLSLVDIALKASDRVIASVFLNPIQFRPDEDLDSYPRTVEEDIDNLDRVGAHGVFLPVTDEIFPTGFATGVTVRNLTDSLCGAFRPGHFDGVTTVCAVLFGIVRPDVAVFGRKDAQQLAVIRRMVSDLRLGIRVLEGDIVREDDGLAMSSRNMYLQPSEREQATALYRGLLLAAEMTAHGERDTAELRRIARGIIQESPLAKIQYVETVDPKTMLPVQVIEEPCLLAVAVYFGETRLIDNIILDPCGPKED